MFSPEQIKIIVKRALGDEPVEVIEHRLIQHSKEKVGFLGLHQNLEVTVSRGAGKRQTLRFFVKSTPCSSEALEKFIVETNVFKQEAQFFNELLPELKKSCLVEEFCPKCLLASERFVVLEDMRNRNFAMSEDKIFSADKLKSAVRAQARLHGLSLLTEARLAQPLDELYPEVCVEHLFIDRVITENMLALNIDLAEQIAKRLGRDYRRIETALTQGFMRMAIDERKKKAKLGLVASHGDTWPNNYMLDDSRPAAKCVLIDFQLVRYAPRTYDVAQLIYLATSYDIRRREEKQVLEAYHRELCEVLKKGDPQMKRPSLEDVLEEYEEMRLSALLAGMMYYPIICMSKAELAKFDDNQEELYNEVMLRKQNDVIMELYDRDDKYAERLGEVVLELVDYCEKHDISEKQKEASSNAVH